MKDNDDHSAPSAGELLTVTQADREAAIAYINTGAPPLPDSIIGFRDDIQSGEGDHYQIVQAFARHRIAHSAPADAGGGVEVSEIETVTGDFLTEPGEPFWRIEIDGYCADFDHKQAAENFCAAINARLSLPTTNQQHPQSNDKEG